MRLDITKQVTVQIPGLPDHEAAELLQRQAALQSEARQLANELNIVQLLEQAGAVVEHGSSVTGLMVWPDLDFGVTSPGLTPVKAFEIMQPLLTNPRTTMARYTNETGSRSFSGHARDERLFFMIYVARADERTWKIDIPFWLYPESRGEQQYMQSITSRLTPESRLAILWLKDIWHISPVYPVAVGSVDIYAAVLEHGVRTPDEFDAHLRTQGKPTRAEAALVRKKARDL